jgi:hypothetical protein
MPLNITIDQPSDSSRSSSTEKNGEKDLVLRRESLAQEGPSPSPYETHTNTNTRLDARNNSLEGQTYSRGRKPSRPHNSQSDYSGRYRGSPPPNKDVDPELRYERPRVEDFDSENEYTITQTSKSRVKRPRGQRRPSGGYSHGPIYYNSGERYQAISSEGPRLRHPSTESLRLPDTPVPAPIDTDNDQSEKRERRRELYTRNSGDISDSDDDEDPDQYGDERRVRYRENAYGHNLSEAERMELRLLRERMEKIELQKYQEEQEEKLKAEMKKRMAQEKAELLRRIAIEREEETEQEARRRKIEMIAVEKYRVQLLKKEQMEKKLEVEREEKRKLLQAQLAKDAEIVTSMERKEEERMQQTEIDAIERFLHSEMESASQIDKTSIRKLLEKAQGKVKVKAQDETSGFVLNDEIESNVSERHTESEDRGNIAIDVIHVSPNRKRARHELSLLPFEDITFVDSDSEEYETSSYPPPTSPVSFDESINVWDDERYESNKDFRSRNKDLAEDNIDLSVDTDPVQSRRVDTKATVMDEKASLQSHQALLLTPKDSEILQRIYPLKDKLDTIIVNFSASPKLWQTKQELSGWLVGDDQRTKR